MDAACARCQARRSGIDLRIGRFRQGSVDRRGAPSARPRRRQPSEPVDDGTPLGQPSSNRPSASTVSAADSGIPSCCAARQTSAVSPTGSAAATSNRRRASPRKPGEPPREALLDARGQRHRRGQPEPARELCRRQPARQLQQSERVPARLDNDPIQHALIQRSGQDRLQQRPRITTPQGLDAKLRQSRERVAQLASREHERDLLRQQATGHERERARRRTVEPLRVIDDTSERPLLRSLGQQAEGRQSDQERIRRLSGTQPEGDAERVALGLAAGARMSRGTGSTAAEAPRTGAPSPPSTPTVRATRNSAPASTAYSSSAVLPTPGSPCTTKHAAAPPRAAVEQPVEHLALALPTEQLRSGEPRTGGAHPEHA